MMDRNEILNQLATKIVERGDLQRRLLSVDQEIDRLSELVPPSETIDISTVPIAKEKTLPTLGTPAQERVYQALSAAREPVKSEEISRLSGVKGRHLGPTLAVLSRRGLARKSSAGLWSRH